MLKAFALLVVFLFLSSIFTAPVGDEGVARAAAGPSPFGQPTKVNDNSANEQVAPVIIALPGHGLFMVWQDGRAGYYGIYSSSSFDNGTNWSANKRVDDPAFNTSTPRNPAVAVTKNGTIMLVWQDNRRNTFDYDIFFAKSYNHGTTFTKNMKVSDGPAGSWQERPAIAVTLAGGVYIAWTDDRTGIQRVRGAVSSDMGLTFSASKEMVPSGTGGETGVSLATYGNIIYAAFMDNVTRRTAHPFSCTSTNGGKSFNTPHRLDSTGRRGSPMNGVTIAPMPSGGFVAAWEDTRNGAPDIYISSVAADGSFIISDLRVEDDSSYDYSWQDNPSVTVDQFGNFFVAWQDERTTGYPAIRLAFLKTGRVQFNASVEVAKPGLQDMQMMPSVVSLGPGQVFAAYQDDKGGTDDVFVAAGTFPNLYGLTLASGFNFVTVYCEGPQGKGYKASTLGLAKGDMVFGWNSSRGSYDQYFIVGVSPQSSDFQINNSTGYWIFTNAQESIELKGNVPTTKQTKKVVVPGGGSWVSLGFASLNSSRRASDVPGLFTVAGGVTAVSSFDTVMGVYSSYIVGLPQTDFKLTPGKAYWCWVKTSGSFNYYP